VPEKAKDMSDSLIARPEKIDFNYIRFGVKRQSAAIPAAQQFLDLAGIGHRQLLEAVADVQRHHEGIAHRAR
jgi:hypothetical protein